VDLHEIFYGERPTDNEVVNGSTLLLLLVHEYKSFFCRGDVEAFHVLRTRSNWKGTKDISSTFSLWFCIMAHQTEKLFKPFSLWGLVFRLFDRNVSEKLMNYT
jgi:hypothetical protein